MADNEFTLEQVADNPDFKGLSLPDKNAFLMQHVPEFKSGAPKDRSELLDTMHYGGQNPNQPVPGLTSGGGPIVPGESLPHAVVRQSLGGIGRGLASIPQGIAAPVGMIGQTVKEFQTPPNETAIQKTERLTGLAMAPMFGGISPRVIRQGVVGLGENLLDRAKSGDVGAVTEAATMAAAPHVLAKTIPPIAGKLGEVSAPLRNAMAERVAQSLIGPEPKNTFDVSRPAPAIVKEGATAFTLKGLSKNLSDRVSDYNDTVQSALKQAANSAPENAHEIIQNATQPIIDQARAGLDERTAATVEKWRDDAISNVSPSLKLDKLYKLKQDIGKAGRTYSGGQVEEPGLKQARQAVSTAINERIGERVPGLRDVTQRESGLIQAQNQLENKARIQAGSPIIPGLRLFGGESGEGGGGGLSLRLAVPGETIAKTALIKALGTREPLAPPIIPRSQLALPSGSLITPPPADLSGVRGIPAQQEAPSAIRFGRLLPEGEGVGPIRMGPSPLSPIAGSEPTPTGGARGFPTLAQPNLRYGGSVRGESVPFPESPAVTNANRALPAGRPTIDVGPSSLPQSLALRPKLAAGSIPPPTADPSLSPPSAISKASAPPATGAEEITRDTAQPLGPKAAPVLAPLPPEASAADLMENRDALNSERAKATPAADATLRRKIAQQNNAIASAGVNALAERQMPQSFGAAKELGGEAPKPEPVAPLRAKNAVEKAEPVAKVAKSVKTEKVSAKTGLTPTQTDYLAKRLEEVAPDLHRTAVSYQPGVKVPKEAPIKPVTIKVPGDGEYTVNSDAQANSIHRGITGKPIEGMQEPKDVPRIQKMTSTIQRPNDISETAKVVAAYGSKEKAITALRGQLETMRANPDEDFGTPSRELEQMIDLLQRADESGKLSDKSSSPKYRR